MSTYMDFSDEKELGTVRCPTVGNERDRFAFLCTDGE
jgi:hypothetical protein